ncbi:MAG TPA: hypothetical protein PLD47_05550 [Aggregatilineales bacterium]|nr:hypothetical protein [Anaerolineales bacterium]HRE47171.1 hypothetical protein [Aggregatilineales bacterium]
MNDETTQWKTNMYLVGGAIGLLIGVFTAYLYTRAADEATPGGTPKRVSTGDAFRVGMTALGLVRQVTELASKK